MRVDPGEFRGKDLLVHRFLNDVPLHDVWAIQLRGGGLDRSLRDLQALLSFESLQDSNTIVRSLFRLRWWLGRLLGWDTEESDLPASSYIHRLTDADRARCLEEPGSRNGPFRVVYTFERESLGEIINATVHAFSAMAMEPCGEGYKLYWAIYVKRTHRLTPIYMALIDPFRRLLIYPAILRRLERDWTVAYGVPGLTAERVETPRR